MNSSKFIILIVFILILALTGGWFYWFNIRPSEIVKKCTLEKGNYLEEAKSEYIETGVLPVGLRDPFPKAPDPSKSISSYAIYVEEMNANRDFNWDKYVIPNAGNWLESKYQDCLRSQGLGD